MEMIRTENLTFTYPNTDSPAISSINLSIAQSEMVVICGQSGCGKTTLLRCFKHEVTPHGDMIGDVYYRGETLNALDSKTSAQSIGFVRQNPASQIVMDTVWHEVAFGLENIGLETQVIRRRVAETAHFFGINTWFEKKVYELSGGQQQILNLAAVMAMQPQIILLDEPTAQLDPIAAKEFLTVLRRVNQELGTTVILSEHRLEDVLPISDRVLLMNKGRIEMLKDTKAFAAKIAAQPNHVFVKALPGAVRIASALGEKQNIPITVREGRMWLKAYTKDLSKGQIERDRIPQCKSEKPILEAKDVWCRYHQNSEFVLRGLSCAIHGGRILAIVGGNASGKTTALGMLAGLIKPVRGTVKLNGKNLNKYKPGEIYKNNIAMLAQDPKTMFVCDSLYEDLRESTDMLGLKEEAKEQIDHISRFFGLMHLLDKHPYDLSGGEQQKAAIAKLLLLKPKILLLDEPTKGIDAYAKDELAELLRRRCKMGDAIAVVTHDVEFAAKHADDCAMIFNGEVICSGDAHEFFVGNTFYTTSANRISRGIVPHAVTSEDVIKLCKKALQR